MEPMGQSRIGRVVLTLALILLTMGTAHAHKVNIFAYAENGMVYTESYFSDGKKAIGAKIEVFDAKNGDLLLEGRTNKEGEFSFSIPKPTGLRLVLTASMGHKNKYLLPEDEIRAALGLPEGSSGAATAQAEASMKNKKVAATPALISEKQLEKIIDKIVQKRTAPIVKKIVRLEEQLQKPSIPDILGGIGYILGLMGVGIYFKYRARQRKEEK